MRKKPETISPNPVYASMRLPFSKPFVGERTVHPRDGWAA